MNSIIFLINIIWIIACLLLIIKNFITYGHNLKICDAIHRYKINCIIDRRWDDLHYIEYKDMEPYEKTFWRLWDWGYTRILPKDKFEIIKSYIK